jgi:hypothetical protein
MELATNPNIVNKHFFEPYTTLESLTKMVITNLPCFIGLYKFCVKFNFHKFIQKLHEFCVIVNMNDICTYSIF